VAQADGHETMKVILFDGSAHPGGSIAELLDRVREALVAEGVQAEQVRLRIDPRTGCCLCLQCAHKPDASCHRPPNDGLKRCARKLLAADGVVIGSPAYDAGVSPAIQRLMALVARRRTQNGTPPLTGKVAAAVVDARNVRSPRTLAGITQWFQENEMTVVATSGAHAGAGATAKPSNADGQGEAMTELGREMARALARLGD
jgi:multimeric flavodoxin WrbA